MALTPYCGRCHHWMVEMFSNVWVCDCTVSGQCADTSKDPNCHNPSHDHHDPESPIVLSNRAINAVEEQLEKCPAREEEAEERKGEDGLENNEFSFDTFPGAEACGHPKDDDGSCTFWGCPTRVPLVDGTPFFDTIDELDEILEDTNRQVDEDTECDIFGHVWGKMGRVGLGDQGLSVVDWGPVHCLRCQEPAPEGTREQEYAPVPEPLEGVVLDKPKHACPGCNLRDLVIKDARRILGDLVLQAPPSDTRREAEQWLRLTGKVRAMKED